MLHCIGFGWHGVNLHSSPYGAVFWICDQNSPDKTLMIQLLLNSACTVSGASLFLTLTHQ